MKKKCKIVYLLNKEVDRDTYRKLLHIMTGVKTEVYNHGFMTNHRFNKIQVCIMKFKCWMNKRTYKRTFNDIYLLELESY